LNSAGFNAREVQQGIHELQEPQGVALHQGHPFTHILGQALIRNHLLYRPQHEGEGSAKFMAYIGKKRRLGAIELGQGLCAPPLGVVGLGVGDRGRDLPGDQIKK
jgi:hypothetical protein